MRTYLILISFFSLISCSGQIAKKFSFSDLNNHDIFNEIQKKYIVDYLNVNYYPKFKNLILIPSKTRGFRLSNLGYKRNHVLDSISYTGFYRQQLLDSVESFKNKLSEFEKWKMLNSKNIDSTLAINIKNFSINSHGTYELCMQTQNRSNKAVNRYKGLIIIMDNYYDTVASFNFLSDEMSIPYVNNILFTPIDYIKSGQSIGSCTRFLNAPIAPREWIAEANGRNIYANDERIKFLINTIIFEDGTILKRP